jgi:hypothetical protein
VDGVVQSSVAPLWRGDRSPIGALLMCRRRVGQGLRGSR